MEKSKLFNRNFHYSFLEWSDNIQVNIISSETAAKYTKANICGIHPEISSLPTFKSSELSREDANGKVCYSYFNSVLPFCKQLRKGTTAFFSKDYSQIEVPVFVNEIISELFMLFENARTALSTIIDNKNKLEKI